VGIVKLGQPTLHIFLVQGRLFDRNPHNAGIIFNLKEPMTLAKRWVARREAGVESDRRKAVGE
jgi:hypothetical protein